MGRRGRTSSYDDGGQGREGGLVRRGRLRLLAAGASAAMMMACYYYYYKAEAFLVAARMWAPYQHHHVQPLLVCADCAH